MVHNTLIVITRTCSLLMAVALASTSMAKELPIPSTPNPGLRYYYPVSKEAVPKTHEFDIVIYGASPAAVSAACQAKKMGKTVGVFVFRRHVGGMSSSGLSDVDYGKKEAIGGMAKKVFLDFFKKQVQSPAEVERLFLTMLTDLDIPSSSSTVCRRSSATATESRRSFSRMATQPAPRSSWTPPTRAI